MQVFAAAEIPAFACNQVGGAYGKRLGKAVEIVIRHVFPENLVNVFMGGQPELGNADYRCNHREKTVEFFLYNDVVNLFAAVSCRIEDTYYRSHARPGNGRWLDTSFFECHERPDVGISFRSPSAEHYSGLMLFHCVPFQFRIPRKTCFSLPRPGGR